MRKAIINAILRDIPEADEILNTPEVCNLPSTYLENLFSKELNLTNSLLPLWRERLETAQNYMALDYQYHLSIIQVGQKLGDRLNRLSFWERLFHRAKPVKQETVFQKLFGHMTYAESNNIAQIQSWFTKCAAFGKISSNSNTAKLQLGPTYIVRNGDEREEADQVMHLIDVRMEVKAIEPLLALASIVETDEEEQLWLELMEPWFIFSANLSQVDLTAFIATQALIPQGVTGSLAAFH